MQNKHKVAILGTQGVPAKYGGFETLVENIIGENASSWIEYTIFCSAKDYSEHPTSYRGAHLRYIPHFHANGAQSILYDIVSLLRTLRGYDTILLLGVSGCICLPVLKPLLSDRTRLIINIDGLEHRREKWGKWTKRFLLQSEKLAIRHADTVIADNKAIQSYVHETYGKPSEMIAYGGEHALRPTLNKEAQQQILGTYSLSPYAYCTTVCRIEPENNCHIILEAFSKNGMPLVFIGNWEKSEYGRNLLKQYASVNNLKLLAPIYDLDTLHALRANCLYYIHGHSAGGTNPSLVEAMHFARPILAYDVVYNRETTHGKAAYFDSAEALTQLLTSGIPPSIGEDMVQIARKEYIWKHIASAYEALYR